MSGATVTSGGWRVDRRSGPAGTLHGSWPEVDMDPQTPAVAICHPFDEAVVLGSTQPERVVDAELAAMRSMSVVRRRSGGGAVWVAPGAQVWIDLWVPAGHQQWDADVVRSFWWVGEVWAGAVEAAGAEGVTWHRGRGEPGPWAATVCFAGIGAGEVVTADGRKLVGLSQRRTRAGSWFSGMAYRVWEPDRLVGVLALDEATRERLEGDLAGVAAGVGDVTGSADRVVRDPLAALTRAVIRLLTD